MASTKARRDSIISHRQKPSIHHSHSLDQPMPTGSLPPPAMAPLHPFVLPPDSKHAVFPLSALFPALVSATRRFRVRPSMIALLALLTLAAFCVLHQHLNDTPALSFPANPPRSASRHSSDRVRHRTTLSKPRPPKIALMPDQELAAIIAFMAALPSNALPESVDPMIAVDPDLVLDFDTRTQKAIDEVHQLVEDTWARLPVVLLSKRYSPIGREIKAMLGEYNLNPSPVVFDIDERADEVVLTPLLYRLTGATDLPILLLAGQPIGSIETIRELHASGQLRTIIAASGAVVDGAKKKKKGRRAAAR